MTFVPNPQPSPFDGQRRSQQQLDELFRILATEKLNAMNADAQVQAAKYGALGDWAREPRQLGEVIGGTNYAQYLEHFTGLPMVDQDVIRQRQNLMTEGMYADIAKTYGEAQKNIIEADQRYDLSPVVERGALPPIDPYVAMGNRPKLSRSGAGNAGRPITTIRLPGFGPDADVKVNPTDPGALEAVQETIRILEVIGYKPQTPGNTLNAGTEPRSLTTAQQKAIETLQGAGEIYIYDPDLEGNIPIEDTNGRRKLLGTNGTWVD